MLYRQRVVLYLIHLVGGQVSRLQLVKLCFLLGQEAKSFEGSSFYNFLPYRYGPYSFSLYHEIDSLVRNGYIVEADKNNWRLLNYNDGIHEGLPREMRIEAEDLAKKYGALEVSKLVEMVYRKHPWFTINSEDAKSRKAKRPISAAAIYTIGYEGISIDNFLNRIMECGISRIVDVRRNPVARRYGFHRSTLSRLSKRIDVEYVHHPEFGIASEKRKNLNGPADYQALFRDYEKSTLDQMPKDVEMLGKLFSESPSALLCMEANPESCHRNRLAKKLSQVSGLEVVHLAWPR